MMSSRCKLLLLTLWLFPGHVLAGQVTLPLTLSPAFLESLLREQVFTDSGNSVRRGDDGSGCQYLVLSEPRVLLGDGDIRVQVAAAARSGRALGERCLLMLDWQGRVELTQQPVVADGGTAVVLRTGSWRALRADGSTDTLSTTVGGWLEQLIPLDLRDTRVSLLPALGQLRDFLALVLPADAAATDELLQSVRIERVTAGDQQVTVMVAAEVPAPSVPEAPAPPRLSDTELAALEHRLDLLDAFFTHVIVSLGSDHPALDGSALREVLVGLRRDLVTILHDRQRSAVDPTRTLFVDAWNGLAPILQRAAAAQGGHTGALRYLTFIGAGDALRALDAMGPAVGLDLSGDGLRRLARILIQDEAIDPLQHDEAVDPALRRVLGFGEPLPPPTGDAPDASWLDWLIPRAVAAAALDPALVKRLNNWVPRNRDMDEYLPMVRDVLRHVVDRQLAASEVEPAFHEVYRSLVFAAAWQESCWRQFTARDDKRVPVESGSGDLGMMQINPRVWRGLYDLHGLRWDIVYNARAGADILEHYLLDYAIRHREHETTGSVHNLARSAYAAYNGGPRQYDRYRRADPSAHGRKVDGLFYQKYREVQSGRELAVTDCYAG